MKFGSKFRWDGWVKINRIPYIKDMNLNKSIENKSLFLL